MPMPEADSSAEISARLAAVFAKIHAERMDGVPILNPRLHVEVIETRAWNGRWLSVLVTPWFINLMLLPASDDEAQAWQGLGLGANVAYRFPAGRFDFIVGEEAGLGRYQMCSLFSPVLEFEDQEAARVAAKAALEALFDADLDEERAKEKAVAEADGATAADAARPSVSGVSRRGLLTGKIAPPEKGAV
jgi:[NiFe] hydrogenase assembly HybE family chaperone